MSRRGWRIYPYVRRVPRQPDEEPTLLDPLPGPHVRRLDRWRRRMRRSSTYKNYGFRAYLDSRILARLDRHPRARWAVFIFLGALLVVTGIDIISSLT
jgi:hypothetical protein